MDEAILLERQEVLRDITTKINLTDTRRPGGNTQYSLAEVFLLVLCAQICDFTTFREYETYGKLKLAFLRTILPYKNGIPSKSCIARVLAIFDPKHLEQLFAEWAQSIMPRDNKDKRILAVDGKTHRGARGGKLHLVNVYDTNNSVCLAQEKVDEKSNEITAIPELLESLSIEGQIISIDAMGCQKKIAQHIVFKKADYFLGLKGNQGDLFEDVKTFFNDPDMLKQCNSFKLTDAGHGRIEIRHCYATSAINWMLQKSEWPHIKSIVMIESTRIIADKEMTERRYFITSLNDDAQQALAVSRSHWGIENALNWVLDVIFKEDQRIIWNDNIARNEATIRRIGLNLVKRYQAVHPLNKKSEKIAIKTLRKILLSDDIGMLNLLCGHQPLVSGLPD